MNEFTGERVIPGQVGVDLWNEHFARYALASQFAAGRMALDIGCGTGYGTAELSRSARMAFGLDISPDAVRHASANFPLPNLRFFVASASTLPVRDGAFDLITAFEVIEHLNEWEGLIREAIRALSANGVFLVSTPNKVYYTESRGTGGVNPFHVHEFEAAEFHEALSRIFPHVTLFLQNRSEAFVFYPAKTFLESSARIESSGGNAPDSHYFLAICSQRPISDLRSFVFVPRAANVLRERERHIALLEHELDVNRAWLEEARAERDQLLVELQKQKDHLEEQNRWALGLEREWRSAQERIVQLQTEFAAEQKAALEVARKYQDKIEELEQESRQRAEWAMETEKRLGREVEEFRSRLAEAVRQLEATERTVEDRTRWATDLQTQLDEAHAQIGGVRASRWVRAGRLFGVGPDL